jgi:hypothetical protein
MWPISLRPSCHLPHRIELGSKVRQLALTSQKTLIFGNFAAKTWNFALGAINVAISDIKRVADVYPSHW